MEVTQMGKLLEVKNLKVQFETSDGIVKALNGIDISADCSTATREDCFGRDPI